MRPQILKILQETHTIKIMSFSYWCLIALLSQCLKESTATLFRYIETQFQPPLKHISFTTLDKLLLLPTQNIPHFKVLLRNEMIHQDAENLYTRWFIEHREIVLSVETYNIKETIVNGSAASQNSNRDSFVIVTNVENLRQVSQTYLHRAGSFFFILEESKTNLNGSDIDMEQLRDILQGAWMNLASIKNYILTQDHGVLIFDPFGNANRQKGIGQLVCYMGEKKLDHMLFSNMRGYPFRVQIFRSVYARPQYDTTTGRVNSIDGVDGEVVRLLQKSLNFSLILQDPSPNYFGERSANGTYNGAIGALIKNEIDMCLTGFFVKDYMVPEMEFTVAVYDDQLCIYVPKASRVPQSILPIFAVSYNLWESFIMAAFACGGVWWIFRLLNIWLQIKGIRHSSMFLAHEKRWIQFLRIFTDTWLVWVRVNVVRYPPFYSERIFLASLGLVSVIFGAIFESSLATVYIHPMYYKDINSLRELDESGLKIIYKYSSMADDLFVSETSELFANLNKKLTHLHNLNADVIEDVAKNGGKAALTRYNSLMLESSQYLISNRVWVIPEFPKYYTIAYVLTKDSPWRKVINYFLLRFLSAGLIVKWINDMKSQGDRIIMQKRNFENTETLKVLTVADLQLPFYVILLGSILSVLSLLLECVSPRSRRTQAR